MQKLVSIIIPTLDRPMMTKKSYESAINQSYKNTEVIVVDNGSSHETLVELEKLGVPYISCTTPGAGAARKIGIGNSNADFLLFLDSDDALLENAIEHLMSCLQDGFHGIYGKVVNKNLTTRNFINLDSNILAPLASNTLLRKSCFLEFGEFSDDNFSWPNWILNSEQNGLNLTKVEELVAIRNINGDNVSLNEDSMAFYFKKIREKLNREN